MVREEAVRRGADRAAAHLRCGWDFYEAVADAASMCGADFHAIAHALSARSAAKRSHAAVGSLAEITAKIRVLDEDDDDRRWR